jgi:hypothetical protein
MYICAAEIQKYLSAMTTLYAISENLLQLA